MPRSYTQEELDEIDRRKVMVSYDEGQIEDLDDEIERLQEMKKRLADWLDSDKSTPVPQIEWEKYPNG